MTLKTSVHHCRWYASSLKKLQHFLLQVIINKSRARYRGYSFNLPVHIQDLEKIPGITSEIRQMLTSHPKVYLEKENPRCHVSQVGPSSLNIAVTCNLKPMVIACQIVYVLSLNL